MVGSYLAPKWPILILLCGMGHKKSNFSLIFGILFMGDCWGQPLLIIWKLVVETQMSEPQDVKITLIQNIASIFLSIRLKLLFSVHCETPCMVHVGREGSKTWKVVTSYMDVPFKEIFGEIRRKCDIRWLGTPSKITLVHFSSQKFKISWKIYCRIYQISSWGGRIHLWFLSCSWCKFRCSCCRIRRALFRGMLHTLNRLRNRGTRPYVY